MLAVFAYFNKTALSSHPLRFTLGFRFKIRKILFNKYGTNYYNFYFSHKNPSHFLHPGTIM